jgi:hypothetical protein
MNGQVSCRSELGKGSTCGLSLPLAGSATPERSRNVFRDFRSMRPVEVPTDGLTLPA